MDLGFPGQQTATATSCIPHDSVYMPDPRAGQSENGFFRCYTWLQIFQNDSKICEAEVTVTPLINKICKPWRVIAVAVSTHRLACSWCSDTPVVEHGGQMTGSELTPQFSSSWIFSSALLNASNRQPIFFVVSLHCITLYQALRYQVLRKVAKISHACSFCTSFSQSLHITVLASVICCCFKAMLLACVASVFRSSSLKCLLRRLPCYMYLCK